MEDVGDAVVVEEEGEERAGEAVAVEVVVVRRRDQEVAMEQADGEEAEEEAEEEEERGAEDVAGVGVVDARPLPETKPQNHRMLLLLLPRLLRLHPRPTPGTSASGHRTALSA